MDDLSSKIIMSDVAHFHLSGVVNIQKKIVSGAPKIRVSPAKGCNKDTACCAVYAGLVIGAFFVLLFFFFENAAGQRTTMDVAHYRAMITQLFHSQLDEF